MSDEEVLRLCRQAKNAGRFETLYDRGDLSAYANDHSAADAGLCSRLAFYTQDPEQINRLFQASALHIDPERQVKWARKDYKSKTIAGAIRLQKEVYPPVQAHSSDAKLTGPTGTWENPAPAEFGDNLEVEFPLDELPECLRIAAEEVGRFSFTDPAVAIVPGLGMASLQIGKKLLIEEKPGLYHHPNNAYVGALETGERKTSVENAMLDEIKNAIVSENPDYEKRKMEIKAHNDLIKDQVINCKKELRESVINLETAKRRVEELYASEQKIPPEPINFCDDITPQRLFQKLDLHGGAYGIFSSDARKLFYRIMGRDGKEMRLWMPCLSKSLEYPSTIDQLQCFEFLKNFEPNETYRPQENAKSPGTEEGWREIRFGLTIWFHTKRQANCGRYLEILRLQGRMADWKYQPRTFQLSKGNSYTPDFLITRVDGSTFWLETLPIEGNLGLLRKLFEFVHLHKEELRLIDFESNQDCKESLEAVKCFLPDWE